MDKINSRVVTDTIKLTLPYSCYKFKFNLNFNMEKTLKLRKIPISEYVSGLKIVGCDKSWLNAKICSSDLSPESILNVLKNYGVKEILVEYVENSNRENSNNEQQITGFLPNDIRFALDIYPSLMENIKQIFNNAKNGKFDKITCDEISNIIAHSTIKNNLLVINIAKYSGSDGYLYNHSINVALLSNMVAKLLGYSVSITKDITLGALLHDIGKIFIDQSILNKKGKLTEKEFVEIKKHPLLGYKFLFDNADYNEIVLQIVLEHHERYNGKGYPRKLKGERIAPYAKVVSIVDAYDALTNDTAYREAMSFEEAYQIIQYSAGNDFPKSVADVFVNFIKNNILGKVVKLDSEEIGIVVETGNDKSKYPKVLIVRDEKNRRIEPFIYDLNSYNSKTGIPYKSISTILTKHEIDFNPAEILFKFYLK